MKWWIIFSLPFLFQPLFAENDHHGHKDHSKSEMALVLNNGQKWSTDQPLRENMSAIHDHIELKLGKIRNHEITDAEYLELNRKVKGNIDSIFANCKLTPQADAQLHIVLSRMLSANSKLGEKISKKEKASAVMDILEYFKAYLKYFDHAKAEKE